jgi:hypothetical protein
LTGPKTPPHSSDRVFRQPWTYAAVGAGFRISDADGVWLAYVFGDHPGSIAARSNKLTRAQSETVARAVAQLPALLDESLQADTTPMPAVLRTPFRVEDCGNWFPVSDAHGFRIAEVYAGERRACHLTADQARSIANGIARLPELLEVRRRRRDEIA